MTKERKRKSLILKISLFATGLSGIVAEYILSTLASYFLGDSILQFTLVLSFMLFAMGLGSSWSSKFEGALLEKFIFIEFLLSILVSFAAILVYVISAYTTYNGLFIYGLSILVGLLIGLEIPLVTRLNNEYETLRLNIASVMQYDYFGSLVGGLFFAFVGLPYLGMQYTPFILGAINFSVAFILYIQFRHLVSRKWKNPLLFANILVGILILIGVFNSKQIILFGEQYRYKDMIVYEEQSRYQKIVITQWQNDYWLFINGHQQLSTRDEELYHEPLVHPVMQLAQNPQNVLIMGGGDGVAVREILKYNSVQSITLVDLDPAMTNLGKENSIILSINDSSFYDKRVKILNQDAFKFMSDNRAYYDVIIMDLPDPRTVELGRLLSKEMFLLCHKYLRPKGILITQAGSPYYSPQSFECIFKTVKAANFGTVPIHNQILTMGEWGWVIGSKHLDVRQLKKALRSLRFKDIKTQWINQEAMMLMTSFGKPNVFRGKKAEVNTIHNPVLYQYYLKGNWGLY